MFGNKIQHFILGSVNRDHLPFGGILKKLFVFFFIDKAISGLSFPSRPGFTVRMKEKKKNFGLRVRNIFFFTIEPKTGKCVSMKEENPDVDIISNLIFGFRMFRCHWSDQIYSIDKRTNELEQKKIYIYIIKCRCKRSCVCAIKIKICKYLEAKHIY